MMERDEHEETWKPFRIVAKFPDGEMREQVWLGRDAEHALERASREPFGVLHGLPVEAKAEWIDVLDEHFERQERKRARA